MGRPLILLQLSDPHIGATWAGGDPVAGLAATVEAVRRLPDRPDAVLISGDIADNADPEEYALVRELAGRLEAPAYVLPGNHDDRDTLRRCFDLPGTSGTPVQYTAEIGSVRRRADAQAPPDGRHHALELPRLPEALHDVEHTAVREATPGDLAGRAHEVAGVAEPPVVDEEHPALRLQGAADELPERLEVPARHVRVPEAEEADVELARRLPLEDVGQDVVGRAAGPRAVQLEHLGDGVDGGRAIRVPDEVSGPDPGPGGELEDVAARPERLERRFELPHVGEPAGCGLGVEGVAGAAEPPVVVLGRPLAVVPPLLGEQPVDRGLVHAGDSIPAARLASRMWRGRSARVGAAAVAALASRLSERDRQVALIFLLMRGGGSKRTSRTPISPANSFASQAGTFRGGGAPSASAMAGITSRAGAGSSSATL